MFCFSLFRGKNFENFTRSNVCALFECLRALARVVSLSLFLSLHLRGSARRLFFVRLISHILSLSLSLIINKQVTLNRQIHFLERVEEKYFKEEEEEPETLIVPDSLAITTTNNNNINNDGTENRFTSAAAFRLPSIGATPKKKQQRTKTRVEEGEEEEYETMVVTNTQMTSSSPPPTAANATRRSRRKSSSSRSPLMEQAQNVAATNTTTTTTPAAATNDETEDEVFKGRSLSPNAEFREAQKIAFNMSNEKKKEAKEMRRRRRKAESSYEDDEDEDNDEGFDLMKDNRNVNAYGETIRVADTLAMNTEYNRISPRKIITTSTTAMAKQKSALNDSTAAAKKRRVDFQFGDRQTEEQEEEERMHAADTPIRETVPAPSGMHVNDDNDDDEHHHNVEEIEEHEREEKRNEDDEDDDGSNDELPLREIFRAKHLIDPRDASQLAPILDVQVLRDESFANDETDHRDHYLAYEIDHEIRDATEISVWKIEDNRSDSSSISGSDNTSDEERAMMKNGKDSSFKSTFRGTVLIGKPSDRDGISSSKKGNGKIKRWAYSVAPNGLVFTSLYTKSSLLSMDETERTHGSSEDDDDMFDDEDEENYFSLDGSTSERRRTFPRKSGVYVHVPVDVNKEVQNDSSEKKSRRSSGRRRSSKRGASMMMGSGGSFPSSSAKEEQKKNTYFELQSPGMAGKVHPRKFASAFSEEYDETVFRLAGVGAEGKCRLWTWSCDENGFAADDDSTKSKKTKKNRTKFATAKMCAKSVTSCKDFEIPTYKSHCVSRDCEITSLSFSKDGNILACVFDKKHVVVWDASTTRVIFSYYCTEYEIENDGLRVLDDAVDISNRQKHQRKTSLTRKSSTPSRRSKSGFNAETTAGGGPIFFFGNFRKIPNGSGDDESLDADGRKKNVGPSHPFSIATFACAYNKELVVGPNASWESPKNGDLVSGVAVCPDVFVEEEEEENDYDDDEEEEKKNNNAQEANKRNTTINVVVTNAGRLGAFEAFGHENEATDAYEGLTFTKQSAFEDISSDDADDDDDTKSRGKKSRKTNFLCASHGKLFAIARRHPGCVSLYAQK